jgi:hypothetical protein
MALHHVEIRLGRVPVPDRRGARLELREMRVEDLISSEVEVLATVIPPGSLGQLHLPKVMRDDEARDRRVLLVELRSRPELRD